MNTSSYMKETLGSNTDKETRRIYNTDGKDTAKVVSLLLAEYIAKYKNKNINVELNKKMSDDEWRKLVQEIRRVMAKLDKEEADFLEAQLNMSNDRKLVRGLQLLLLAELLTFTGKLSDAVDKHILSEMNSVQTSYSEDFSLSESVDEESIYEDNLLWNGVGFRERLRNNAGSITAGLITALILGMNRKDKGLKDALKNKVDGWVNRNISTILVTEKTSALGALVVSMANANGVTHVQFKTMDDMDVCKICESYADEVFAVSDAPSLPIHPNERCYYIPYDTVEDK